MANRSDITPELIRQLFSFDESSGKYYRKTACRDAFQTDRAWRLWNQNFAGKEIPAPAKPGRYAIVSIFGLNFRAHRIIWAFHNGEWPKGEIDHINHDKADNRLCNLRDVSSTENQRNRGPVRKAADHVIGVTWSGRMNKWRAEIGVNGKTKFLGHFSEKSDAIAARAKANAEHGYHANHGIATPLGNAS